MNKRLLRPCKKFGCPNLTRDKNGYCKQHIHIEEEKKARRNKYYDNYVREEKYTNFYHSKEWTKLRDYILTIYNGLDIYAYCINKEIVLANTVHHIVEIKEDWDKRLDMENLFPVSESNHNVIHNSYKEDKEGTQKMLKELLERFRKKFNISPWY